MQLGLRQPKKRPRHDGRIRSRAHLNWIRCHKCLVDGCKQEQIEAHHVPDKTTAAMGLKSGDEWAVPLCKTHHAHGHSIGWAKFETRHGFSLRAAALTLAKRSPVREIREAGAEHE